MSLQGCELANGILLDFGEAGGSHLPFFLLLLETPLEDAVLFLQKGQLLIQLFYFTLVLLLGDSQSVLGDLSLLLEFEQVILRWFELVVVLLCMNNILNRLILPALAYRYLFCYRLVGYSLARCFLFSLNSSKVIGSSPIALQAARYLPCKSSICCCFFCRPYFFFSQLD